MLMFATIIRLKVFFFLSANSPPQLNGDPVFNVTVGEYNEYILTATDPDGHDVTISFMGDPPEGSNLTTQGNNTAIFVWDPQDLDAVNLT